MIRVEVAIHHDHDDTEWKMLDIIIWRFRVGLSWRVK